jgi:hypothetical protein
VKARANIARASPVDTFGGRVLFAKNPISFGPAFAHVRIFRLAL